MDIKIEPHTDRIPELDQEPGRPLEPPPKGLPNTDTAPRHIDTDKDTKEALSALNSSPPHDKIIMHFRSIIADINKAERPITNLDDIKTAVNKAKSSVSDGVWNNIKKWFSKSHRDLSDNVNNEHSEIFKAIGTHEVHMKQAQVATALAAENAGLKRQLAEQQKAHSDMAAERTRNQLDYNSQAAGDSTQLNEARQALEASQTKNDDLKRQLEEANQTLLTTSQLEKNYDALKEKLVVQEASMKLLEQKLANPNPESSRIDQPEQTEIDVQLTELQKELKDIKATLATVRKNLTTAQDDNNTLSALNVELDIKNSAMTVKSVKNSAERERLTKEVEKLAAELSDNENVLKESDAGNTHRLDQNTEQLLKTHEEAIATLKQQNALDVQTAKTEAMETLIAGLQKKLSQELLAEVQKALAKT